MDDLKKFVLDILDAKGKDHSLELNKTQGDALSLFIDAIKESKDYYIGLTPEKYFSYCRKFMESRYMYDLFTGSEHTCIGEGYKQRRIFIENECDEAERQGEMHWYREGGKNIYAKVTPYRDGKYIVLGAKLEFERKFIADVFHVEKQNQSEYEKIKQQLCRPIREVNKEWVCVFDVLDFYQKVKARYTNGNDYYKTLIDDNLICFFSTNYILYVRGMLVP